MSPWKPLVSRNSASDIMTIAKNVHKQGSRWHQSHGEGRAARRAARQCARTFAVQLLEVACLLLLPRRWWRIGSRAASSYKQCCEGQLPAVPTAVSHEQSRPDTRLHSMPSHRYC
jgi:hypothetical protein